MIMQKNHYKYSTLINIDSQVYIAIDENLTIQICDILNIKFIFLFKSRSIRNFNKKLSKYFITHAIYFCLIVNDYKKRIYFIFMTKLKAHKTIIEKS